VPEDVAVIGRGNDSFDDIVTPAISTMDDGLARQGKAAFDLVRLQLENLRNGHDGEQTLLVPPEFIRRSSSG
jgi:DNA-binding LacI/PurR family transcriptional regulator